MEVGGAGGQATSAREQERCEQAAWQVLPSSPHLHSHQDRVQPSLGCRTASVAAAFAV